MQIGFNILYTVINTVHKYRIIVDGRNNILRNIVIATAAAPIQSTALRRVGYKALMKLNFRLCGGLTLSVRLCWCWNPDSESQKLQIHALTVLSHHHCNSENVDLSRSKTSKMHPYPGAIFYFPPLQASLSQLSCFSVF